MEYSRGADLIIHERIRQIEEEGWTAEHDANHTAMSLAVAGAAYALFAAAVHGGEGGSWRLAYSKAAGELWPFDEEWWKPTDDPVRQLVKAGALIAAEIDRRLAEEASAEDHTT